MNRPGQASNSPSTLSALLLDAAENARAKHLFFCGRTEKFETLAHRTLARHAISFGATLAQNGVDASTVCITVGRSPRSILIGAYAAIAAGAKPLIVPAPDALGASVRFRQTVTSFPQRHRGRVVILVEEALLDAPWLASLDVAPILAIPDSPAPSSWQPVPARCDDVAYLQSTSASTGPPKALLITHANVMANLESIHAGSRSGAGEKVCSWLPMSHDMGLVGAALFSLRYDYSLVILSPYDFLRRPGRWLKAISEQRCTLSPAPNFGYAHATRYVQDKELEGLDLSSWRLALCGGEPVIAQTMQQFARRFAPMGFRMAAFCPCYGLAEATLAVTFHLDGGGPRFVVVSAGNARLGQQIAVLRAGRLTADPEGQTQLGPGEVILVSVGRALSDVSLYLVDEAGRRLVEQAVCGQIVVSGPGVSPGYMEADDVHSMSGAVATGDLGFLFDGDLYVVERLKNVVIRQGQNYAASQLEAALAAVLRLPVERVFVLEARLDDERSEVIALIETTTLERRTALDCLREQTLSDVALPIDKLHFVSRGALPRTSSGKKQHYLCRQLLQTQALSVQQTVEPSVRT